MMCKFCSIPLPQVNEELPIKSNADLSRTFAFIAQGDNKKEIIIQNHGNAYGIEINFCPICGKNVTKG